MSDAILGHYGLFVGPAYVVTVIVFLALAAVTRRRLNYWSRKAKRDDPKGPPA